jgi:predicted RNA-binding Zn ribbon-like protein
LRTESPGAQAAAVARLRGLRAALFHGVTGSGPLTAVHGFVARAVGRAQYEPSGRLAAPYSPGVITDRCALAAHRLLEDYGPDAVGLCASAACGWVFLDPAHRRRWCTMSVCGNRAKARRFADRKRVSPG